MLEGMIVNEAYVFSISDQNLIPILVKARKDGIFNDSITAIIFILKPMSNQKNLGLPE